MNNVKLFSMKLKDKLFERLREQSDQEGRSLSEIVRQGLLEYIERKENERHKKMKEKKNAI